MTAQQARDAIAYLKKQKIDNQIVEIRGLIAEAIQDEKFEVAVKLAIPDSLKHELIGEGYRVYRGTYIKGWVIDWMESREEGSKL